MSVYHYDPFWKTYRLEPDTQDFSLVDVPDLGEANVEGNAKDNVITGNDADNTLNGMLGADTLIGGLGNDRYDVDSPDDVVIEEDGEGSLDLIIAHTSYVLPDHVEVLDLGGYDAIDGTGNDGANDLFGNNNSNRLDGRRWRLTVSTVSMATTRWSADPVRTGSGAAWETTPTSSMRTTRLPKDRMREMTWSSPRSATRSAIIWRT